MEGPRTRTRGEVEGICLGLEARIGLMHDALERTGRRHPLLDAWLEAGRTTADGTRLTDKRLTEVFDLVKDAEHWKNPLDARVPKDAASPEEITLAVSWFCGGLPDVVEEGDLLHVTGGGYWEWVGA